MAAESFRAEASCSVCRGLFQDPVSIHCGHNFCRACITRCWGRNRDRFPCPRCHQTAPEKKLRPNRELAKVIEVAGRLSLRAARGGDARCPEHRGALKLFCEDDRSLICLVCRETPTHRPHTAVPVEEAVEELKEKFRAHVQILKDRREKLLGLQAAEEGKIQELLDRVERERQTVASRCGELRRVLEGQERLLLGRLAQLERDVASRREEKLGGLRGDVASVEERIRELEEQWRRPARELLRDSRSILSRLEEEEGAQKPAETPPELEHPPATSFPQKTLVLKETLTELRVSLTLDPDTAHPRLVLSEDLKGVRFGDARRPVPDNPERFDSSRCVLARRGFAGGRGYWEVTLGDGAAWAIGLAKASVGRKGRLSVKPEAGIWALGRCGSRYQALASPVVPLPAAPRKIGVFVDYEAGRVAFYDAGDKELIFAYPPVDFGGEEILPLLCLGRGCEFTLSP